MTDTRRKLRFLLLQVRNADDSMRGQEIECFARALDCGPEQIGIFDLLSGAPTVRQLDPVDMVLLGGSGDYSVAEGGTWLSPALEAMRELYDLNKPTFASCWGFQAMARALGGNVVTDLGRAELGTVPVQLTPAGREDPIFGHVGPELRTHMGHQDRVDQLPDNARLLASTDRVRNQAFCVDGKPIYCTQFHPELTLSTFLERVVNYPWYVERIAGVPLEAFVATCEETPEANALLRRFVTHVFE
ncbi:MAG: type 1 glutamine amidotransferase [Pirellulaceae bacterium]